MLDSIPFLIGQSVQMLLFRMIICVQGVPNTAVASTVLGVCKKNKNTCTVRAVYVFSAVPYRYDPSCICITFYPIFPISFISYLEPKMALLLSQIHYHYSNPERRPTYDLLMTHLYNTCTCIRFKVQYTCIVPSYMYLRTPKPFHGKFSHLIISTSPLPPSVISDPYC